MAKSRIASTVKRIYEEFIGDEAVEFNGINALLGLEEVKYDTKQTVAPQHKGEKTETAELNSVAGCPEAVQRRETDETENAGISGRVANLESIKSTELVEKVRDEVDVLGNGVTTRAKTEVFVSSKGRIKRRMKADPV